MKNLLSSLAMACFIAITALAVAPQVASAQTSTPPGPCTEIYLSWKNFNTPSNNYPLRVDFTLQNPSTGATSTVSPVTGAGNGSLTVYNGPTQPRTVTTFTIVDSFGNISVVDLYAGNPQTIPSATPGKCFLISWNPNASNPTVCPILIEIEEVNC